MAFDKVVNDVLNRQEALKGQIGDPLLLVRMNVEYFNKCFEEVKNSNSPHCREFTDTGLVCGVPVAVHLDNSLLPLNFKIQELKK